MRAHLLISMGVASALPEALPPPTSDDSPDSLIGLKSVDGNFRKAADVVVVIFTSPSLKSGSPSSPFSSSSSSSFTIADELVVVVVIVAVAVVVVMGDDNNEDFDECCFLLFATAEVCLFEELKLELT